MTQLYIMCWMFAPALLLPVPRSDNTTISPSTFASRAHVYPSIRTIDTPVVGDWVVIHTSSDADDFNVVTATDLLGLEVGSYIFEALGTTHPFTLEAIPWLADSLPRESKDHLSYEFRIRPQAKFSDGHPVTARDFILYMKAVKNPAVVNAAPVRAYFKRVKRVEMINNDSLRVRVVMKEPYVLGDQLASAICAVPAHVWDRANINDLISFEQLDTSQRPTRAMRAFADIMQDRDRQTSRDFLVGSGPYMFDEHTPEYRTVVVRNPHYWNTTDSLAKAYPEKLVWKYVPSFDEAVAMLKSGDIDVMPSMPKTTYNVERENLAARHLIVTPYDNAAYTYYGFNLNRSMFSDRRVRNALARALDRETIIKESYFGLARPIQSPYYVQSSDCDTTLPIIQYDLDTARKLLAQAGWIDNDGDGILDKVVNGRRTKFTFEIMVTAGNSAAQSVSSTFVKSLKLLGIVATITAVDWSVYLNNTRTHIFDMMLGSWSMPTQETDLHLIWHSASAQGGSNHVAYKSPRVDALIEQMQSEFNRTKRRELARQVQRQLYEDQPYIFILTPKYTAAYSARFRHVQWFTSRPGYNPALWWVPKELQKYKAE